MNKNNADSNELTMLNHIKRLARGIKMVLDSMKLQPIDRGARIIEATNKVGD